MATTTTETKKSTHAGRGSAVLAGVLTLLGLIALAVPLGAMLDASFNTITLTTKDQINQVLTLGVVLSAAALVFAVVAVVVGALALLRARPRMRVITEVVALLVAIGSGFFLFGTALPRAQAVQNLNNNVVPFAQSLSTNCQTPLDNTTADLNKALNDVEATQTDNASFAAAMQTDSGKLSTDASALSKSLGVLNTLKAPDAKYTKLLQDCINTVKAEDDFLTNDNGANAIALPAPYSALVPGGKVSGIDLLKDAGLVSGGLGPIHVSEGALQPLVGFALQQVLAVKNPVLTQEGDQLKADIQSTLDTNLSPFVVKVALS